MSNFGICFLRHNASSNDFFPRLRILKILSLLARINFPIVSTPPRISALTVRGEIGIVSISEMYVSFVYSGWFDKFSPLIFFFPWWKVVARKSVISLIEYFPKFRTPKSDSLSYWSNCLNVMIPPLQSPFLERTESGKSCTEIFRLYCSGVDGTAFSFFFSTWTVFGFSSIGCFVRFGVIRNGVSSMLFSSSLACSTSYVASSIVGNDEKWSIEKSLRKGVSSISFLFSESSTFLLVETIRIISFFSMMFYLISWIVYQLSFMIAF